MPKGFRPPKPNWLLLSLGRIVTRPALRWIYGIVRIEYTAEDLRGFGALGTDRILLAPNHPTNAEPVVMFHLSGVVRRRFYFVSNRESFDRVFGLFGKLLQSWGAYSIVRGAADRESFKFTRKLLAAQASKLVIFPEGEVYSQNDTLLPFHDGVFQLALGACEDMRKAEVDAPLWILPVAIKYRYLGDARRQIGASLGRLETALGIREPKGTSYDRLVEAGMRLLRSAEAAYHLKPAQESTMQERIDGVREAIIGRVSDALGISREASETPLPDRMRRLYNEVYAVIGAEEDVETVYDARLASEERHRVQPMLDDLKRLANWVAVRDTYVAQKPSVERYIDTLRRMEVEVLGTVRIKARKVCIVRLGTPIDVRPYLPGYVQDRKSTVSALTEEVETRVQALIDRIH